MKRFLLFFFSSFYYIATFSQKDCRQDAYQQRMLELHPQLHFKYAAVAAFTGKFPLHKPITAGFDTTAIKPLPEKIIIPVVVHILWNTAAQNISNAQVLSQIDVLNSDYSGTNADRNKIPSYFSSLAADCGISFVLAKTDPRGHATSGIERIQTNTAVFSFNDNAKAAATGGADAWNADNYLNIWVCNLENGISGYSSVPGGPKETDGIVISTGVFGTINISGPFNRGRTAVHETGHWLNLRHIWGDANCGDDQVDDTPTQQTANRGCITGEKFTCGSTAHGDMYMNFMDFSDDGCMYMFTKGQRQRMRALFEAGGPRNSLLFSNGLVGDGLPVRDTLAVNNIDVLVYPNPARASVTVQLKDDGSSLGKHLYICNQLGQVVKMLVITSKLQQADISTLPAGLYMIKVEGMQGTAGMKKFVKQ